MPGADGNLHADDIFPSDDGPDVSVEAAVQAAEQIAEDHGADDQAVADAIREQLLPILHRLPVTDLDVAVKAVAKLLPVTVTALREEVREWNRTVEAGLKATAPQPGGGKKPSQADVLFAIAQDHYDFIKGDDGVPYAIPADGPRVARAFRGSGSLRAELAATFAELCDKVPGTNAVVAALQAVEGHAMREPTTPVHLRTARVAGAVWLDLGRQDGAAVVVTAEGWAVVEDGAPVTFRRTPLTAEMPIPEPDGDVGLLRDVIGVLEGDAWRLVVGWLVSALLPDIPRPVLFMAAEAGAAKTTIAKMLVNLIDPSPAPTRSMPREEKDFIVAAAGSAVVCLDNLGFIPAWLSDAICRAVTGEGFARRRLYTDGDIAVTEYRRAVIVTGIDVSADRGDLLDRCVPVELKRIPDDQRREERAVLADYEQARPAILGGLLDLLAAVLRELPDVDLQRSPRMADHARVLAALDRATGWGTLPAYIEAAEDAMAAGIEADHVALAVRDLIDDVGTFQGIASELLETLDDRRDGATPPKRWPSTPQHLAKRLRLVAPTLRAAGYRVDDDSLHPKKKTPMWTLQAPDEDAQDDAQGSGDDSDGSDEVAVPPPPADTGQERDSGDGSGESGELPNPFSDAAGEEADTDDGWETRL